MRRARGCVGRKTSTRGAVAGFRFRRGRGRGRVYHPSFASLFRTGVERARARGFHWGVFFSTLEVRAWEILSLVGIVHSFVNAKNGAPTDGKVGRYLVVFVLVVYPNLPSGNGFAGRSTGRASDLIEIAIGSAD